MKKYCLNCDKHITTEFCPECGQKHYEVLNKDEEGLEIILKHPDNYFAIHYDCSDYRASQNSEICKIAKIKDTKFAYCERCGLRVKLN